MEIACTGGTGQAGTALACLAVLDGAPGREAAGYVREHYAAGAAEASWQRRYVTGFGRPGEWPGPRRGLSRRGGLG